MITRYQWETLIPVIQEKQSYLSKLHRNDFERILWEMEQIQYLKTMYEFHTLRFTTIKSGEQVMSTVSEQIEAGIVYALENKRPVVGAAVAHREQDLIGELKAIKEGMAEVFIPGNDDRKDETYFIEYDKIFNVEIAMIAAHNCKFGFPIGDDGTFVTVGEKK